MARLKGHECVSRRRRSVRPSVVRSVVISKNARDTAQPAVVIDDRPVTPCLGDIDSSSASAQQTICWSWRGEGGDRPFSGTPDCGPAFHRSGDILVYC